MRGNTSLPWWAFYILIYIQLPLKVTDFAFFLSVTIKKIYPSYRKPSSDTLTQLFNLTLSLAAPHQSNYPELNRCVRQAMVSVLSKVILIPTNCVMLLQIVSSDCQIVSFRLIREKNVIVGP